MVPAVLSGCIDTGDVTTGDLVTTPPLATDIAGGPVHNFTDEAGNEFFVERPFTAYFTPDHGFDSVRPERQVAVAVDGVQEFTSGNFPHPWFTSPSGNNIHYIEPLKATMTFTTDKIVTFPPLDPTNPRPVAFVFSGFEDSYVAGATFDLPQTLAPGQLVTVTASLELPRGGFMHEKGNRGNIGLAVLSTSAGSGAQGAQLQLVTGGPQASSVTGVYMLMPFNTTDTYSQSGNVAKSVNATDQQPMLLHEFQVTNETRRASFGLTYRGPSKVIPSMWVTGPDGRMVMGTFSPVQAQKMTLYRPNFNEAGFGKYKVFFSWDTTFGGEPTMNFGFEHDVLTHLPPAPPSGGPNQTTSRPSTF